MSLNYGDDVRLTRSTTTVVSDSTSDFSAVAARAIYRYSLLVGLAKNVLGRPKFFGFSYDFVDIPLDGDSEVTIRGMTGAGGLVSFAGIVVEVILEVYSLSTGSRVEHVIDTLSFDSLTGAIFNDNSQYYRIDRTHKLSDVITGYDVDDIAQMVVRFKQTSDGSVGNVVFGAIFDGPL